MTFKPTMALLMLNLSHEDRQKVQDGKNKKKQKTQREDPTYFMCMFMVSALWYLNHYSPKQLRFLRKFFSLQNGDFRDYRLRN